MYIHTYTYIYIKFSKRNGDAVVVAALVQRRCDIGPTSLRLGESMEKETQRWRGAFIKVFHVYRYTGRSNFVTTR